MNEVDRDLLRSMEVVLTAIIGLIRRREVTPKRMREMAEVLEGQARVVREAAETQPE